MSKVIAIDGPSGSGKSTIAKLVSEKLSLVYLDTGAMFRGLGYSIKKSNINFEDHVEIDSFLKNVKFEYGVDKDILIRINDEDLTSIIRQHEVSKLASEVSQVPSIRTFLKEAQREIASSRPSILEGRDIGTVIFPKAVLKFFLTADPRVRAQRRLDQLIEKDITNKDKFSVESILEDIETRDKTDQARAVAPLLKAEDAIAIDTSNQTVEEIINFIMSKFKEKEELFK
jgi:cytidylate kinase